MTKKKKRASGAAFDAAHIIETLQEFCIKTVDRKISAAIEANREMIVDVGLNTAYLLGATDGHIRLSTAIWDEGTTTAFMKQYEEGAKRQPRRGGTCPCCGQRSSR